LSAQHQTDAFSATILQVTLPDPLDAKNPGCELPMIVQGSTLQARSALAAQL
jgi:hypothetical protein